jgi:pimeloyl-ACP methyl ester carboxylesterase
MPVVAVNGINLSYQAHGSGEPVLLIMGSAARGRMWEAHQVPALTAAGYRVITVDNRGVPPSDVCADGFTLDDMVADTACLIERLELTSCRIVGFSLGGMIVQELLLAHPGLISQAVLMATRGRLDRMRSAMSDAESDLHESGVTLPRRYAAVVHAMRYLSPQTLNHEQRIRDWLDVLELSLPDDRVRRAHADADLAGNRLAEYRKIRTECLVLGFQDDLIVPPRLCLEVAKSIPHCRYAEVAGCGHYGCLEQPAAVNDLIIEFFGKRQVATRSTDAPATVELPIG